jgi:hypothetical protein
MASVSDIFPNEMPGRFQPSPEYDHHGDVLAFFLSAEECRAERMDELLTVYISDKSGKLVGFEVENVVHLLKGTSKNSVF